MDTNKTLESLEAAWLVLTLAEGKHAGLQDEGITSREFSLARTKLQEAGMWFVAALAARYGYAVASHLVQRWTRAQEEWEDAIRTTTREAFDGEGPGAGTAEACEEALSGSSPAGQAV